MQKREREKRKKSKRFSAKKLNNRILLPLNGYFRLAIVENNLIHFISERKSSCFLVEQS